MVKTVHRAFNKVPFCKKACVSEQFVMPQVPFWEREFQCDYRPSAQPKAKMIDVFCPVFFLYWL